MNVGELKKILDTIDDEVLVVTTAHLRADEFEEVVVIDENYNFSKNENYGEIGLRELTERLKEYGFDDTDLLVDGKPCIVI